MDPMMKSSSPAIRFPAVEAQRMLRSGRNALAAWTCAMVAVAFAALPAQAVVGTIDNVPGATLLLPYFEVDLNNPQGTQTSFTVVNTGRAPTTAKVTLWTDYAVPSFHFDLYLGGRDTVEVDLGLLFNKGIIPKTAPSIGAAGPFSDAHNPLGSCNGILPPPDQLGANLVNHLQAAHIGTASAVWGGQCGGAALGDAIARGYVTIDVTSGCSFSNPTQPGYFVPGGMGVATNQNLLIGESKAINRTTKLAITEPLIALEASNSSPVTTLYDLNPPGPANDIRSAYTFYGRFVINAADNREPLGGIHAGRVINGGAFPTGSTITAWRDFDRTPGQQGLPFACNTPPAPMPQRSIALFDEQERAFFPGGQPGVAYSKPLPNFNPNVFPRATQRVHSSTMNAPTFGWAYIDLNNGDLGDGYFNGARQSFVSVQHLSNGKFGGSLNAKTMWNVSEWALRAGTNQNNPQSNAPPFYQPSFPSQGF